MGKPYSQSTKMVNTGPASGKGSVVRVKTEGRIGSPTPPAYLKGGLNVNNNTKAQSHKGDIGKAAPSHMSPGHTPGHWSPRVAKARKQAETHRRNEGLEPINHAAPALKPVKPE